MRPGQFAERDERGREAVADRRLVAAHDRGRAVELAHLDARQLFPAQVCDSCVEARHLVRADDRNPRGRVTPVGVVQRHHVLGQQRFHPGDVLRAHAAQEAAHVHAEPAQS
jgi:hypothetical protein